MNKKNATVIFGFPGVGKSYFKENSSLVVMDSDSSKEKNVPGWEKSYLNRVEKSVLDVDFILMSTHDTVIKEAASQNFHINYSASILIPHLDSKGEYIERFKRRGSPEGFINLISNNWEKWIRAVMDGAELPHNQLMPGKYLSDYVAKIMLSREISAIELGGDMSPLPKEKQAELDELKSKYKSMGRVFVNG